MESIGYLLPMPGSNWTAPAREAGHCTLLVIDDDEIARYILRTVLRGTSVTLVEAAGSKEGLATARQSRPDAVLLDFTLVGENAQDVLDLIKKDPDLRGIPVIMLTAHEPSPKEWKQLALETAALLSKDDLSGPNPKDKLRDALRKVGIADLRL